MSKQFQLAEQVLLAPGGLALDDLGKTLARLMAARVDYADLYFQYSQHESWVLDEGVVKSGTHSIDQGVGLRAVCGEKTGFAYSDELHLSALLQAADVAKTITVSGGNQSRIRVEPGGAVVRHYPPLQPLGSLSSDDKVALLHKVEQAARAGNPQVDQVMVNLAGQHEIIMIVRTDGTLAVDIRPLVRMNVSVIMTGNGRREQGTAGGGGRYDYSYFSDERAIGYAEEAVRQASVNLAARPAPAGDMQVVLGPGWPGILLHEAIGHGLEGDFNRKGTSVFSGRLGERVATPACTVVDNGTLENRRGSLSVDDEGCATQNTVLIENGILTGYMQDQLNARLMKQAPTGNGRRESYAHLPMPRMTNTYMHNGDHDPDEIIASVKKGLYAVNFGGGQVDITSGKFVFSASEAYLIENGKKTAPVTGATLIGNGPEVLMKVAMVGNDLALDSGVGVCGKEGQSVPVGVGQPTMRIDGLTVGGVAV